MPAFLRSATGGPEILIAEDASPSELWAAAELRAHLAGWTGGRIAIGGDLAKQFGLKVPEGEACQIRTCGGTLVIAGGRERGTMYGVFGFLDRLGFRWFTNDVAYTPRPRAVRIGGFDEVVRPAFAYREVFFTEAQEREWSARNGLNGNFHKLDAGTGGKIAYQPFAHSFYDLVPPADYFASHPEYFALVAGKRRSRNAQLCLSNAALVPIAQARIRQWLADRPEISVVSVSQNDGGGWCECDECSRIVAEEGGSVSGLLLRFVNKVADPFAHLNPRILIDTLAYQKTIDPPASTRPAANVQIRFCPINACQAHSYRACVFNRKFEQRMTAWLRIAPRLVLWQYSINFSHFLLPFPNEAAQNGDFERLHAAGVSGIFVEGAVSDGGGGDNAELRSYLAARLLRDPKANVPSETRAFLHSVYGNAAPAMDAWYKLRAREMHGEHLWIDQDVDAPYLTFRFLDGSRRELERARNSTESAAARKRIDHALLGLDYVAMMREKHDVRPFFIRARQLGISHLREGYPIDLQERALLSSAQPDRVRPIFEPGFAASYVDPVENTGWQIAERSGNRLVLAAPGLRYESDSSGGRLTARNTGTKPLPATLRLSATLPLDFVRGEKIGFTSKAGEHRILSIQATNAPEDNRVILAGDEAPEGTCVFQHAGAGLKATEATRWVIAWSFRKRPQITVIICSPEIVLGQAEELILASEMAFMRRGKSE